MALYQGLKRHFKETAMVFPTAGLNVVGGRTHSTTGSTYAARHEQRVHRVVNSDGQVVTSRGTIYLAETSTGGLPNVGLKDKVQQPGGTVFEVIAIDTPISTSRERLYHQVLHYR